MSKGMTLIEFIIVLLLGSLILLSVSSLYIAMAWAYGSQRSDWICMQSLRTAMHILDRDIEECAYLLPRDLKVVFSGDKLFVAGLTATNDNKGLSINSSYAPPYYSTVSSVNKDSIVLDTLDIDTDGKPDYIAGQGIISDSGAYEIMNNYSRGNTPIPLKGGTPKAGDRTVPAVLYQVTGEGLYRNNQLISENITGLSVEHSGSEIKIIMRARSNETAKEISFNYSLGE